MYKLEYKAKIDDNCNKNIYIMICVFFVCARNEEETSHTSALIY